MDNLTHGLLGLAVGALRRPDAGTTPDAIPARLSPTDKAVLAGCLLAAEMPDLDIFFVRESAVLRDLTAHRGYSHSLIMAPVIALAAALIARLVWRRARLGPVYGYSLISVLLAHLVPDLWTGWGTMLLLPFSEERISLDLAAVVDPYFTLPLLAGALLAWRYRSQWRRMILAGLVVASVYMMLRVGLYTTLSRQVIGAYPGASQTQVFPSPMRVFTWRYVAQVGEELMAGDVRPGLGVREQARHPADTAKLIPPETLSASQELTEAIRWARFPYVTVSDEQIRVAGLRYHAGGQPTLTYVFELENGRVVDAYLDRSGRLQDLLQRYKHE